VLHVVIRAGSGVVAAIEDYIDNTPEFSHHIVIALEPSADIGDNLNGRVATATTLPDGRLARMLSLRRVVADLHPDVIHAHSSFAGFYARVGLGRAWRARTVYTPHCYSFVRTDISRAHRRLFKWVESILAHRGGHIAACSPLEAQTAARWNRRQGVTYVPNIARGAQRLIDSRPRDPLTIVTVGRVTPQKDPAMFARAAAASRDRNDGHRWVWIGGGNRAETANLERSGVEVTGWVPRNECLAVLRSGSVYVHTAAWEGAPISILEAAAVGLPIVGRRIESLECLGIEPLFGSIDELIEIIDGYPSGVAMMQAFATSAMLRERHTAGAQRAALLAVYGGIARCALAPASRPGLRAAEV